MSEGKGRKYLVVDQKIKDQIVDRQKYISKSVAARKLGLSITLVKEDRLLRSSC